MAKRLRINNPDLTQSEKSYLTSAYSSGVTLNVVNSFAFSVDNFAVLGVPGKDEKIEAKRISAVPAGGLTLTIPTALSYTYPKDTVVYQSRFDQIEIESSSGVSFALISTSSIQWDKPQTLYVDASGNDNTSYRWRFKNSSTLEVSEYSPTLSGAGFSVDQVGYVLREVRLTSGDLDGRVKKDREVIRDVARAIDIIYARIPRAWFFKFNDNTITTTASNGTYNLDLINGGVAGTPTILLGRIGNIRFKDTSNNQDKIYPLSFKSENEFDQLVVDNNEQDNDEINVYTIIDGDSNSINGYIRLHPTPKTTAAGTLFIRGYLRPSTINSVDDKVIIPVPSVLIDYCVAQIEKVRGNDAKAQYYEDLFWGPSPSQMTNRRLTGIALLEKLDSEQKRPVDQPRQLIKYHGRGAMRRMYGNRNSTSRDYKAENYF